MGFSTLDLHQHTSNKHHATARRQRVAALDARSQWLQSKRLKQPRPWDIVLTDTQPRIVKRAKDHGRTLELWPLDAEPHDTIHRDADDLWHVFRK